MSRQFNRASLRADVTYRKYDDFYASVINGSTGKVTNSFGQSFDLSLIENTDALKRQYSGLTTQGEYRLNGSSQIGGQVHALARMGKFRGRERQQRSVGRPDDRVPGIQAGVLEFS